jgi:hypothetical protein
MILLPSTVTPELAEAASSCVTLVQARKLAEWIGASRPLTPSGILKPALAIEACQLLGIELPPGRLRTALDLDEFMLIWDAAGSAGYIVPNGTRVRTTPRLADTSPGQTVQSWLNLMSAGLGLREGPCGGCLTVLHELSVASEPLDLAPLAEAVRSLRPSGTVDGLCPDCGEVHDLPELTFAIGDEDGDDSAEHAADAVGFLVGYGAAVLLGVQETPGEVRAELTPLGRMLAESLFTGCAPPAEADAATFMDVICAVPLKIASAMAEPWLADDALRAVGIEAPDFETPGENFTIEIIPPTEMPPTATHWVRLPSLPAGEACQLKVTLRDVSKPPVWRRIVVPAALSLGLLHHIIQEAMGWEGSHLHVFRAGRKDYGDAHSDLGFADESKAVLAKVLARPGAVMRYTYDFGDEWEHDVVLEKVLPPEPVVRLSCLAGKGACPPEDCGGAWGYANLKEALADPGHEDHEDLLEWLGLDDAADFDPAWFRLDEVNARLGQMLT